MHKSNQISNETKRMTHTGRRHQAIRGANQRNCSKRKMHNPCQCEEDDEFGRHFGIKAFVGNDLISIVVVVITGPANGLFRNVNDRWRAVSRLQHASKSQAPSGERIYYPFGISA